MNFADLQKTWQSPHNRPSAAELENYKMTLIAEIRRRHRGNLSFLLLIAVPLVFLTAKVIFHMVSPNPELDPVNLPQEWGIIPFFALPWIGWLCMAGLHFFHRKRHPDYGSSIHASVSTLLDENRSERLRYKVIGVLLIASVGILPLVIHQLRTVGKAGDEILIPAYVIYPTYVLCTLAGLTYFYRTKLTRRHRELETLLQGYTADEPA